MPSSEITDTIRSVGYVKVIVSLATTAGTGASLAASKAAEPALEKNFILPPGSQLKGLAAVATASASLTFRRSRTLQSRRVRVFPHLGLAIGYVDQEGVTALENNAAVRAVERAPELSLIKPVLKQKAVKSKETSWGIARMGVDQLWDIGITGKGVLVGHLDTGVDASHPVLQNAIADFAEFDRAGDLVPGAKPYDSGDHGTHTAGTIVGRPGPRGAFGVAPEARLASAMVIEGGQVIDRILGGMDWVIERGCRILNMSLGLRGYTPAFEVIIDAVRNAGVLPVIAVGNEGPLTSRSPGNYSTVLSVGAMDADDLVADFSSSEEFMRSVDQLVPDLVAPGMDIVSCVPGNDYASMDGSSMATPHVAGLAALLFQAKPGATIDEVEKAIMNSCRRPKTMPLGRGNRGVPDAARAYEFLTGTPLPAVTAAAAGARRKIAARKPGKKERMPVTGLAAVNRRKAPVRRS